MNQPCLAGLCCRDMILSSEADNLGLTYDYACNLDDPGCGCPDKSVLALEQWQECFDYRLLDLARPQRLSRLAPCVPNLKPREKAGHLRMYSVIAVKATDMGGLVSRDGPLLRSWRERYEVASQTTLLVHQESRDERQGRLFPLIQDGSVFELMQSIGRAVFIPPGLSVYDDGSMCPLRQILHMRLSLRLAAKASLVGLDTVPVFGWNHARIQDIEFLAQWCKRQGDKLQVIAVNAQTGSLRHELRHLALGMVEIERQAQRQYRWIVFGGLRRIESLAEFIPRHRIIQVSRPKDFQVPLRSRSGSMQVQLQLLASQ